MMYRESSGDMSGGKHKDNILTKLLHVNSPHYFNDQKHTGPAYDVIQGAHLLHKNQENVLQAVAAQ